MANKGQLNEYEKSKLLRVQENKQRLHQMGIKNIVNSLRSLAESNKTKKKKVKTTHANVRDVDYTPEIGEDSGEDYLEVAKSVEVAKRVIRLSVIFLFSLCVYICSNRFNLFRNNVQSS